MSIPAKKNPPHRPKKELDFTIIDSLCELQCTAVEICGVLGVCEETLNARIRERFDMSFSEYYSQKGSNGKVSLRRRQYKAAMDGNSAMLIWLGKQWLEQSEKHEIGGGEEPIKLAYDPIKRLASAEDESEE